MENELFFNNLYLFNMYIVWGAFLGPDDIAMSKKGEIPNLTDLNFQQIQANFR